MYYADLLWIKGMSLTTRNLECLRWLAQGTEYMQSDFSQQKVALVLLLTSATIFWLPN